MVRGEAQRAEKKKGNSSAPCTVYFILHILRTRVSCSRSSATKGISYTSVNLYTLCASLKWSKLCLKLPSRFSPDALRYVVADSPNTIFQNLKNGMLTQGSNLQHKAFSSFSHLSDIFWKRNCLLLRRFVFRNLVANKGECATRVTFIARETSGNEAGKGPVRGSCAC